jgi:hypothetical protein
MTSECSSGPLSPYDHSRHQYVQALEAHGATPALFASSNLAERTNSSDVLFVRSQMTRLVKRTFHKYVDYIDTQTFLQADAVTMQGQMRTIDLQHPLPAGKGIADIRVSDQASVDVTAPDVACTYALSESSATLLDAQSGARDMRCEDTALLDALLAVAQPPRYTDDALYHRVVGAVEPTDSGRTVTAPAETLDAMHTYMNTAVRFVHAAASGTKLPPERSETRADQQCDSTATIEVQLHSPHGILLPSMQITAERLATVEEAQTAAAIRPSLFRSPLSRLRRSLQLRATIPDSASADAHRSVYVDGIYSREVYDPLQLSYEPPVRVNTVPFVLNRSQMKVIRNYMLQP